MCDTMFSRENPQKLKLYIKFYKGEILMDAKKLFSIGEIAAVIGITRRIILNYEAKGLIKPSSFVR